MRWRNITRHVEATIATRHIQAGWIHWREAGGAARVEPGGPRNRRGVEPSGLLYVGTGLPQECLAAARILRELLGMPRWAARMGGGASGATGAATAL